MKNINLSNSEILNNYLPDWDNLPLAGKIQALCQLESTETQNSEVACILPMLLEQNNCFWLKAKLYISMGRLRLRELVPFLLNEVDRKQEIYWRLLALDALNQIKPADLSLQLGHVFSLTEEPLLLRAVVWILGENPDFKGGEILALFISCPLSRWVKDELLWDSWQRIISSLSKEEKEHILLNIEIKAWVSCRRETEIQKKSQFGIYPHSGYLWQVAEKNGLSRKEYQEIFWWHKKKHRKKVE